MKYPKISVIMSVYKEPLEWLRLSIDSILNQTLTDFEFIIICDNPNYEEGINLLHEYEVNDKRIQLIFNKENIGLTKSLNEGLAKAKGEYIARMDADDISLPKRFEMQVAFMEEFNDIDLCHTGYHIISNTGEYIRTCSLNGIYASPNFLLVHDMISHPTVLFKSSLLKLRQPFYNENYKSAQDYDLWSFLLINGCKIQYLSSICLQYRVSYQQVSNLNKGIQSENGRIIRRNLIKQFYQENGVNGIDYNDIMQMFKNTTRLNTIMKEKEAFYLLRYFFYYNISIQNPIYSFRFLFDRYLLIFILPFSLNKHVLLSRFLKKRWNRMLY